MGLFCPPPPPLLLSPPDPLRESVIALVALMVGAVLVIVFQNPAAPSSSPQESVAKDGGNMTATAKESSVKENSVKESSVKASSDISAAALQRLLEARRSIQPKGYTGALVPEETVRQILKAAPWAPSHGKTEPWRFVVFGGAAKQKLLDMTLSWYNSRPPSFWHENFILAKTGQPEFADGKAFAEYFAGAAASKWGAASHLVALCVRRQRPGEGKKQHPEWEEDAAVSCAVQNMHLMATTLKVGAYWSSWYAQYRGSAEISADLGLEPASGDRCLGVFVIGEPQPSVFAANRAVRQSVDEVTRWVAA